MSQQICISCWNHKICRKATTFRLFSISRTLCQIVYKFQASSFDELRSFLRAGMLCLDKCDEGRFSSSVFTSLCWRMVCFKALQRLCSFGIKLPCVNPTSPRADSQCIIILKTFELVTLSFSQFHAQRNWLLTHALHIFNQYVHETAMLFLKPDVTKKNGEFFFHCLFC